MKKNLAESDDEMLPEYDFRGGERGKYAREYGRNKNIRILAPDLLEIFPDSQSVNEALRTLVHLHLHAAAAAKPPQKISAKTASAPKSTSRKKGRS